MPSRSRLALFGPFAVLVLLAGCAGSNLGTPTLGTLALVVTGLPTDVAASIRLVGPAGSYDFDAEGTSELEPGTYEVEAGTVLGMEPLARTRYEGTASSSSVSIVAGTETELTVDYEAAPGSHRIWLSAEFGPVAYDPSSWSAAGSPTPAVSLSLPAGWTIIEDLAFSDDGDLFTAAWTGGVVRYDAADLDTDGAAPAGTVALADNPNGVAWHDGRLYVMNWSTAVLLRFDAPEAIVGADAVGPDAVISVPGFTDAGVSAGLAFDDDGRLWVAFANGLVRINEPESPMGTVDVTPDAAMTQSGTENRLALTYLDDTLFTAACFSDEVQRYDGVDAVSGSVARAPTAVFTVDAPCVSEITQDAEGRFWLAHADDVAGRYPDLTAVADGATTSADRTITHGAFVDGGGLRFRSTTLD
jgi:sugar lactone lactonase YvrE